MSKSTGIQCTTDLPIGCKTTSHNQHPSSSPSTSTSSCSSTTLQLHHHHAAHHNGRNTSTFKQPSPSRKLQHQMSCVSICPTSDAIRRQKFALAKINNPGFSQSVPHISHSHSNGSATVSTSTSTSNKNSSLSSSSSTSCCTYCSDCCNNSTHNNVNNNNKNHQHLIHHHQQQQNYKVNGKIVTQPQHVLYPSKQSSSPSNGIYYASNGVTTVGNNYINCHNNGKRYQQQKYLINLQHAQAVPSLQAILLAPTTTKFSSSTNANYSGFCGGGTINNGGHGYSSHHQVTFSPAWPTLPRSNSSSGSSHGHCHHRNCHQLPLNSHLDTCNHHQTSSSSHNQLTNLPSHSYTTQTKKSNSKSSSSSPPQLPSPQKAQCHFYYNNPSVASFNSYECQDHTSSSQCNSKYHQFNLHNQHHHQQQKQVNGQSLQWHNNQQIPASTATTDNRNHQVLHNNAISSASGNTSVKYTLPTLSTFSGKEKSSSSSSSCSLKNITSTSTITTTSSTKRSSVTFEPTSKLHSCTMDTYSDAAGTNGGIVSVDYDGNSTGSNTSTSSGIGSSSNYSCSNGSTNVPSVGSNCTVDDLAKCNKSKIRSSISSGDSSNSSSLAPVSERSSDTEYSTDGQGGGKLDQDLTYGPLDELDVSQYLVYNISSEEHGYEIKGGKVDALIVKATEVSGSGKFTFTF